MAIIQEGLRLQEQHEVVMGLFKLDSAKQLVQGTFLEFCSRTFFIFASALAFMFLLDVILPNVFQIAALSITLAAAIFVTMYFLTSMNKGIADEGIVRILKHGLFVFLLLVVMAFVA